MSEKKYKEFWIAELANNDYFDEAWRKDPAKDNVFPATESIHVIEHAAYEELLKKFNIANDIIMKNMGATIDEILTWDKNDEENS